MQERSRHWKEWKFDYGGDLAELVMIWGPLGGGEGNPS